MSVSPVDWDLAVRTARRLAPPGPQVSWADASTAVSEL
ncbi:MAG: Zincin-like metallopeptidase, partial [Actinomycetota bacterium]|nr:Zincin-like metallopeptidase [Actinomycetota bacterium]